MNRFNNFFQGEDIFNFLRFKGKDDLNLKLLSVFHDVSSLEVQAFTRVLGLVYYRVTKPFWELLQSKVNYCQQYVYIQKMLQYFQEWSEDSGPMLQMECQGIFGGTDFPLNNLGNDTVYKSLINENLENSMVKKILEKLMISFTDVTRRQLVDFLPGGAYGAAPSNEMLSQMAHCHLTNLLGENEFGDLDFSQFCRKHATIHYHSSVQMVKKNKTISKWLCSKSNEQQSRLLDMARNQSQALRKKHIDAEKEIRLKTKQRLEEAHRKRQEKEALKVENKRKLVQSVRSYGGPFTDVKSLKKDLEPIRVTK